MKRSRALLAFALVVLAGCGPAIPPAGNYATLTGRVTDAKTGAGLAGAIVTVNVVQSATTDATGAYTIANVPTGPWSYTVSVPAGYAAPAGSDTNAPLVAGEKRHLDFALASR